MRIETDAGLDRPWRRGERRIIICREVDCNLRKGDWMGSFLSQLASCGRNRDNHHNGVFFWCRGLAMSRATLEERVAALESQVAALLANQSGTGRAKDWRRTRGVFTGDDLMKQVFEEGRKIRDAERKPAQPRGRKKPQAQS